MESKIKEARKAAGLTQKQVYEILGIPARTQQDWEAGKRTPAPWLEEMVIREYQRIAKNEKSQG
ncbi:helix-turn-helix transcriptional regulator [Anaerovoracaceae bacterium 41-7]|jgi:DNA-binding transcriptional regulator YiaG|uniref:XRE family transcriptional regulator n=1 Tax=Anaerotruncus colihominis TaxID=169435 RepID=A0A845QN90_9FIRM|nr:MULTISPECIES: helix-turn-helix transcriptional regulator [Eubacteriales]MCI9640471.1 helix-turn-helix transcriptional regulator [Emergencia sp.]NBH62193.1 XRE family transcriptional regulator [Anaerotruncus colihominis]NCF02848.1 XRE family transcriptional regulator [Anaerotruncus sp. 80]